MSLLFVFCKSRFTWVSFLLRAACILVTLDHILHTHTHNIRFLHFSVLSQNIFAMVAIKIWFDILIYLILYCSLLPLACKQTHTHRVTHTHLFMHTRHTHSHSCTPHTHTQAQSCYICTKHTFHRCMWVQRGECRGRDLTVEVCTAWLSWGSGGGCVGACGHSIRMWNPAQWASICRALKERKCRGRPAGGDSIIMTDSLWRPSAITPRKGEREVRLRQGQQRGRRNRGGEVWEAEGGREEKESHVPQG